MLQYLVLFFGVFVISWSSILIRWIGDVHPLVISFYRLLFSALILLPFVVLRRKESAAQTFSLRPNRSFVLAGFFLALHFFSWIQSLQLTTVAHSIFLESTHPIFALILSYFVLKERSTLWTKLGIALALAGMYLIVATEPQHAGKHITGDLLAILSAFSLAAYLLVARFFTKRTALLPYLVQVYGSAAIITLVFILLRGTPLFRLTPNQFALLFVLALGPHLTGHSLLNWAARKMPVYLVNLAMQAEAVLASLYAAWLLQEYPGWSFVPGALLILIAVSFIFLAQNKHE
jgi:drug/metabolite transporter (DMT)-like permease